MKEKIQSVISGLGLIEVHGKNNLDLLLGCIMTLELLADTMQEGTSDGD